jgi:peptidoglycan/xylan/chitin deacetylase (PgdA/CDA1 family)
MNITRTIALSTAGYLVARRVWGTVRDIGTRRHPGFVYGVEARGVPVFTYHSIAGPHVPDSVTPDAFARDMRYLAENGYHALTAGELLGYLVEGAAIPPRPVVLTFDDGRASLWTAAFPVLQQYGLHAISFLVPGSMAESGVRPHDHTGPALDADVSDQPMITWEEARLMHASGLVEFQSHTLDHTLIFFAPEIVDFASPAFATGYAHVRVPVLRCNGTDRVRVQPAPGTPLYRSQPRMSAARRFFDDEGLRHACVDHVRQMGATAFFAQPDWRAKLHHVAAGYRRRHTLDETVETGAEQVAAIRRELEGSKQAIEAHLSGHSVRCLCYPWHRFSMLAASLAREAGYTATFIDINPQKPAPQWNDSYTVQRVLPVNEYGDDPHQITRIDARGEVILSLPGHGRLTYSRRVAGRLLRLPHVLQRG